MRLRAALLSASHQTVSNASRVESRFKFLLHTISFDPSGFKVRIYFGAIVEVITYDSVSVSQIERIVSLHYFFRCCAIIESIDYRVERDASSSNPQYAFAVGCYRNWLCVD